MAKLAGRHKFYSETRGKGSTSRHFIFMCLLLVLFFLLTAVPDASAARRRVIFQLANLQQWAEMEYTYAGNTYEGAADRSSQDHKFEQKYHLDIDYAILGRRLANGTLALDVGLEQNYENTGGSFSDSDGSQGFNLGYDLSMLVIERSDTPVFFSLSRGQEKVNEPFSSTYDEINQHYSANLSLKNKYLPSYLDYHYSETETEGLSLDRFQSTERFNLSTYLELGEFSTTNFQVEKSSRESRAEGHAFDTATDTYGLEARNLLTWTALAQRQILHSSYRLKNETGTSELTSEQWDERLRLRLGKALETEFSHQYSKVETPLQFRREQKSEFWIEHHLFKSFVSNYHHNQNKIDFDFGVEESWQRNINLAYNKKLPLDGRFRLSYSYSYGETDRNLDSQIIYIDAGNPETKQIDAFFEVTLEQPVVLQDSIVVSDAFGIIPATAYSIVSYGSLTALDFNGNTLGLTPGDSVFIEYAYNVNNSIKYSTTTNAIAATLGLFNQQFRIYGNLTKTNQDLISGKANVSSLIQQDYLQIGIEGTLNEYTLGSSYSHIDSTISTEEYFEAFLNYRKQRGGRSFSLRLTERFSSISQKEGLTGGTSGAIDKNSITLYMDYRRQLARNTTLTLNTFLADIRGDHIEKDEMRFGLLLESRWYKFLFRLNADVTMEFNENQTSHVEHVSVALRRYF